MWQECALYVKERIPKEKMCYSETRLSAQNKLTILDSIVNTVIEHLCDHSRESVFLIFDLILDVEIENYDNPHYLQLLSY